MNNLIQIQLIADPIYNKGVSGYLDIKENTDFPLNFSVAEIRDITKRKGSFSKTIKLAGSKNNNILLNNYFDVNVIDGTFNVNTLQQCIVLENNIPILENAYIQLLNVTKVQTNNRHEQLVEYEVIIKDSVADFLTKLGNAELTDIKFEGFNHTLTAANVVASFSNDVNDVYKYIMPQNYSSNTYNLQEWLPGIYAKQYWDKIFANAGFTYEWPSLTASDVQFDKLIIPYNGDAPKLTAADLELYKVVAELSSAFTSTTTPAIGTVGTSFRNQMIIDTELQDDNGDYNPTLGEYTSFLQITNGFNTLSLNFTIDYDVNLNNVSGATAYFSDNGALGISYVRYTPVLFVYKNGVQAAQVNLKQGGNVWQQVNEGYTLTNGINNILGQSVTVNVPINNLQPGDILTTRLGLNVTTSSGIPFNGRFRNALTGGGLVQVNPEIVANTVTMTIQPSINSLGYGSVVDLNQFIPLKVKQSDYIKSIITMFNLIIDVDKTQPNKLLIRTRDEYYDAGTIVDWTKKINKNKNQLLQFLPELTAKKIKLSYKLDDNDVVNKGYLENVREIYGQQDFTFDNEYIKGEETKELIFSPTPVDDTIFGAVVPAINGAAPKMNIRILYDGGMFNCNTFHIYDYVIAGTGYGQTLTQYPLFSHFDHPTNPSYDINFGICDYYFYGGIGTTQLQLTNNNLYNLHWRRTLNQINENKLLTVYVDLTGADIYKMKLNDKIRIDNSYWNINKVIDYNPSKPGPTKVELISIDDELKLAPFRSKIPKLPVGKGDYIVRPIIVKEREILKTNNVIASPNVDVIGKNNIVGEGTTGYIYGDGNEVYTKNAQVTGENNKVYSDAVVIGSNNTVDPGLENVQVFGNDINATESNTFYAENIETNGTINGVPIENITSMGTSGLSGTLAIGNTTDGNDIVISSGDKVTLTDAPTNNNSATEILVRNSSTGDMEYRDIATFPAGTSGGTGTSGTSGSSGATGTSGTSGVNGTSGSSGVNGNNGTSGSSGASGLNGTSGSSGVSGLNGTSGSSGINGANGTSGSSGINGNNGTSGSSGVNGNNGTSGSSGVNGADGTSGSSGVSGLNGTSGSSGVNGNNGTSGSSGINGNNGTSGSSGINGVNGTSGTSGINGTSGSSGVNGNNGTSGSSGINGVNGTSGSSGINGNNGTSGSSGVNGANGTSGSSGSNGAVGTSGTSGITGTSGTSGTATFTITTVSTNTTISVDVTLVDTSTTALTMTLPTAVGRGGKSYVIKDKIGNANNKSITIDTTSSQTIDGNTRYTMNNKWEAIKVVSDGSNWFII